MEKREKNRLWCIDWLRGTVMVLMALDPARAYWGDVGLAPEDLDATTPALFATGRVTHFRAPVFVRLTGTSAWLYGRQRSRSELAVFLFPRGLWLAVPELTLVRFTWLGTLSFPVLLATIAFPFASDHEAEANDAASFVRLHHAAHLALEKGELGVADRLLWRCLDLSPRNPTLAYGMACVAVRAGEVERALELFTRAVKWGYADAAVAEWDDDLAALRNEAEWDGLLAAMRETAGARAGAPVFHRIVAAKEGSLCSGAALSPDGTRVAVAEVNGVVRRLDAKNGSELDHLGEPFELRSPSRALHLHPSGRWLATGHESGAQGGWVRVWDLEARTLLWEHFIDELFVGRVNSVRFSTSGKWLAASTGDAVYLVVLDAMTGERVWESGMFGGRMGEPVEVRWGPNDERFWFSYVSGVMPLWTVAFAGDRKVVTTPRGRPPSLSPAGDALVSCHAGIALVDATSLRVRWARPVLEQSGWLVQASSGYFDGEVDLEGLAIRLDDDARRTFELARFAKSLHDPKRVRAAIEGIRLVMPEL